MRRFLLPIVIEKDKEGYFVFCPTLQGCYSQGNSYEEAIGNIEDAIRLHLEDRLARDESYLLDILKAGRKLIRITSGMSRASFEQNDVVQDSAIRQIEIIGEAAQGRLSLPRLRRARICEKTMWWWSFWPTQAGII